MKIMFSLQEVGEVLYEYMNRYHPEADYTVTEVDVEGYGHNQQVALTLKRKNSGVEIVHENGTEVTE